MNSIASADLTSQTRVLVRCDLDVPLENGDVQELYRLESLLPTLDYILGKGAHPVICGHIGRPGGQANPDLSTEHLRAFFNKHLGEDHFTLLENLRFDPGEDKNSLNFAKTLALKAEVYVNESFATCHRFSASMVTLPELLPSFAGIHLMEEVSTLSKLIKDPERPLIAIIGGAKLESKKPAVKKFAQLADLVLVGGKIGLDWDEDVPQNVVLPQDYAEENKDIGPQTIKNYIEAIKSAKTIIWSGPLGMFEDTRYINGTKSIAYAIAQSSAYSIIGGGDTIAALSKTGYLKEIDFISTGGGALLEFLLHGNLPALESLGYHG